MYPGMAKAARDEGFGEIADWFETLAKAERIARQPLPEGARSAGRLSAVPQIAPTSLLSLEAYARSALPISARG